MASVFLLHYIRQSYSRSTGKIQNDQEVNYMTIIICGLCVFFLIFKTKAEGMVCKVSKEVLNHQWISLSNLVTYLSIFTSLSNTHQWHT